MTKRQLVIKQDGALFDALVEHLLIRSGVSVQLADADGALVLDTTSRSSPCEPEAPECRDFRARNLPGPDCPDGERPEILACPCGRSVRFIPIRRAPSFFGSLVAHGPDRASLENRFTVTVLDAMIDALVEDSTKKHEIDSLAGELALRYEEIELLYEIDEHIPLRSYTTNVIEYVADKILGAVHCSCLAWVGQMREHQGSDDCRIFWNPNNPTPPSAMLRVDAEQLARAVAERCLRTGETLAITSLAADPELRALASELDSVISLPLRVENDLYGCFVGFKPRGNQFTSYELKLMTALSRKGAFVIRDSRLYEDLDSLFFNLIKLLVNTIENKDVYTKGHSQRVKTFTVHLAELMGLPKEEVDVLNVSGLLHDIGKQGIPDAVLKKEGKLTEEERAMINTHPIRGVNLIKHIKQFEKCLPHIQHHHERIDGRGYPDGLKDGQIPLGARIIAVADTFDALTSDRCYRDRFNPDKALQIIREVSGTQLDPAVVQFLLDHRGEFEGQVQKTEADDREETSPAVEESVMGFTK